MKINNLDAKLRHLEAIYRHNLCRKELEDTYLNSPKIYPLDYPLRRIAFEKDDMTIYQKAELNFLINRFKDEVSKIIDCLTVEYPPTTDIDLDSDFTFTVDIDTSIVKSLEDMTLEDDEDE